MYSFPSSVPDVHRQFLNRALDVLRADVRIVGVAAGGSLLSNSMDVFSDIDLVLAVEPEAWEAVLEDRQRIAASLGTLLCAFTGEHVQEPRLLVCLYAGPLHVDLKFVSLPDVSARVEDPVILWERAGRLTRELERGTAAFPAPDLQWVEDRFWVWIHYAVAKVGRGELFEALDLIGFLRASVLGPIALMRNDARPAGLRRLEQYAPRSARELEATIARYDPLDCIRALRACIESYRALRDSPRAVNVHAAAESAATGYLNDIEAVCRSQGQRAN